jgi:hypothetical protein
MKEHNVKMPAALDPNELMNHFTHAGQPAYVERWETERL